jgi:hypothetical protein
VKFALLEYQPPCFRYERFWYFLLGLLKSDATASGCMANGIRQQIAERTANHQRVAQNHTMPYTIQMYRFFGGQRIIKLQ